MIALRTLGYIGGVTSTARSILDQALALPIDEREALVDELVSSLQRDMPDDIEQAWMEEIRQRLALLERGETVAVEWSDARRRLRAKYDIG